MSSYDVLCYACVPPTCRSRVFSRFATARHSALDPRRIHKPRTPGACFAPSGPQTCHVFGGLDLDRRDVWLVAMKGQGLGLVLAIELRLFTMWSPSAAGLPFLER